MVNLFYVEQCFDVKNGWNVSVSSKSSDYMYVLRMSADKSHGW